MNESTATGMDLGSLGDLSSLLSSPTPVASGVQAATGPEHLSLNLIDEDPHQPRSESNPGFSLDSLEELAETIRQRGVKSPISVRENPDKPGHFIINHGARRYRASRLAKKDSIPAFVDNDYNEADQVIENLQRNELTAREVADFVGRELAKNKKKGAIAKELGKSASWVSQYVTLLDLPDPIAEAFNTGRVNDVTIINELVKEYKASPDEVTTWLDNPSQDISRAEVKLLREYLAEKDNGGYRDPNTIDAFSGQTDAESGGGQGPEPEEEKQPKDKKDPDPEKLSKAIVLVAHDGRSARLLLKRRPSDYGSAWFKYEDDGTEFEATLDEVTLTAVMEG
ncbi:hypothetical protein KAM329D_32250 [Aeromonas caviae]|jgi:ParB family transcriptional regulator, chromosome partitioning protein|uniref:ParB/RepB/Spo0J family partition protein n=1 Tax=Aeromonas caviae TaxID=648 RepID=UPI0018A63008|nr:ParB/RepB/Spo0J family partition protein [Aeromonas caviae]MDH1400092.1 ParB/RepB/Spo0J family partition protein [Aeromonas caviae]BCM78158.1 hypothetical protein KAM329_47100 [Aeromonas caviae]GJA15520.1 hypothetical protein KAM335_27160 [Aeromonas caviae]GJA25620.1 hypothetical protein KAM337_41480 [Aeromonas caviae]GJC24244.1 hypothetical protein KAM329D_32250 [Aeromonas caviae]